MGLLEKAGQINSGESTSVEPAKPEVQPEPVAAETVAEPEPVQSKKRSRKKRAPRKKREPREKKVRVEKTLPEGYEVASRSQRIIRRGADFLFSYGWAVPIAVISAWGTYFDGTYFYILGLLLVCFNLGFMPYSTGRTVGNWISRTTYISSKSTSPHQSYHFLKGITFPLVLIGFVGFLTSTAEGFGSKTGQIYLATSMLLLLPSFVDYLFYRFKKNNLGLWDTLYGGIWMVKTVKSTESKGWLKRLEQLGDYSEAQGWWSDNEPNDDSSTPES
ncbi:MAG: hypothetical protein QF736_03505 [Candidatus Thalassarchaeaceae archaeon]|nr:hypothetical protein [Candidatus Thalassarchaeaceae archaeon]